MDRYFKYLNASGARPTLRDGTLRWSRPSRFNDLFDMSEPFSTEVDRDFVAHRALDLMWERLVNPGLRLPANALGAILEANRVQFLVMGKDKFQNEMRPGVIASIAKLPQILDEFGLQIVEHLSKIKVLCFSNVNDDTGMWGLYAAENQGVVLEFASIPGLDSAYGLAKPIVYADRAPPVLTDEGWAEFLAGNRNLEPDIVDPLMFFKSSRWRDEKELRLVSGLGRFPRNEVEDIRFHPRELVGVYFGVRGSALRTELESLVRSKYPHAKLWQAIKGKTMKIEFSRISESVLME